MMSFPKASPVESDCYRVEYGEISGRVMSFVARSHKNIIINKAETARRFIDEAYQLIFNYQSSVYGPSAKVITGLLKHINRVEKIVHSIGKLEAKK